MKAAKCEHASLRMGSGGYYIMCADCQQTWVARRIGGESDADLDRQGTSQTPLWHSATWRAEAVKP